MDQIIKYPRTRHLEGSKEQYGDDLDVVSFQELKGKYLVVEEKMDGANSGISFNTDAELLLQSRGHILTGGHRERHFNRLKTWANMFMNQLWDLLGDRYIMYGEWMYAKHTIYYDALPHYFLEFDIYDKQKEVFLSTKQRMAMLETFPFIHSVRILEAGDHADPSVITQLIGPSYAITKQNKARLEEETRKQNLDTERAVRETDLSGTMEGLYVKEENEDIVMNRFKYVRGGFIQAVFEADGHWQSKPIIPNQLQNEEVMYEMDF